MRVSGWSSVLVAGVIALSFVTGSAAAAPALDDDDRAWVLGKRVEVSEACWSADTTAVLLEGWTPRGWMLLATGRRVRNSDRCPRKAYPWVMRFEFVLTEKGTRKVPGSSARVLELRTRAPGESKKYFTSKWVYLTKEDCRAELRAWQCDSAD